MPKRLGAADSGFTIEKGIDAIDQLRTQMREAGMTGCADALDEAFVRCLRDYVTRPDLPGAAGVPPVKRGKNNLN